ncbi:MAG: glycerophosphodiester phosphodiesterase [Anaerolineae bacterium]|nr:glycerophosphodiester phosphodiesterase [Anaerolineae bacterium]
MIPTDNLDALDLTILSTEDHALAARHAPRIRFDAREPFLPSVVGYTVFYEDAPSPSFPRQITLPPGASCAVEYAVWWDWDIEHLYELEHIWVYVDGAGNVVDGEASWHGGYFPMVDEHGAPPIEDGRLTVYSEPGKHAFAASPRRLHERAANTRRSCTTHAGHMCVHVTPLFDGVIQERRPLANRLVHTYLERFAFTPSYEFSQVFDLDVCAFVPWENLRAWIPKQVAWWVGRLRATIPPHEQRVLRIAHRGASAYAQENSLAAFRKAAELGADMVEIDIRATADGVPVVSHDSSLKRVFGVEGNVGDYTLSQLRALTPADREPIPTLEEVAAECRQLDLGLYLDIKELTAPVAAAIVESLDRHHLTRYSIAGSFRADWLAEIKANFPQIATSILFASVHVDPVLLARSINCDYVHPCWESKTPEPHRLLTPAWIEKVRAADLGIICWHEERPSEIAALQALGVDGICSDQPELLVPPARRA